MLSLVLKRVHFVKPNELLTQSLYHYKNYNYTVFHYCYRTIYKSKRSQVGWSSRKLPDQRPTVNFLCGQLKGCSSFGKHFQKRLSRTKYVPTPNHLQQVLEPGQICEISIQYKYIMLSYQKLFLALKLANVLVFRIICTCVTIHKVMSEVSQVLYNAVQSSQTQQCLAFPSPSHPSSTTLPQYVIVEKL